MLKIGDKHKIKGWIAVSKTCRRCGNLFVGFDCQKYCGHCPRAHDWICQVREALCAYCGTGFTATGSGHYRYCPAHRKVKSRKAEVRQCQQCGRDFRPGVTRSEAKLCSRYCQGLWINANGLGPKYDDVVLRARLVSAIKRIGIPLGVMEVLAEAGISHKTLTARGWKIKDLYAEAGVKMPNGFQSRFEARVYEVLLTLFSEGEVETQKSFDDLKSVKGFPLFFDFWIPGHSAVIEADGLHHYYDKPGFFDSTVRNDSSKNDYCKERGIRMLRIRYSRQLSRPDIRKEIIKFLAPIPGNGSAQISLIAGTVASASQSAAKPVNSRKVQRLSRKGVGASASKQETPGNPGGDIV